MATKLAYSEQQINELRSELFGALEQPLLAESVGMTRVFWSRKEMENSAQQKEKKPPVQNWAAYWSSTPLPSSSSSSNQPVNQPVNQPAGP